MHLFLILPKSPVFYTHTFYLSQCTCLPFFSSLTLYSTPFSDLYIYLSFISPKCHSFSQLSLDHGQRRRAAGHVWSQWNKATGKSQTSLCTTLRRRLSDYFSICSHAMYYSRTSDKGPSEIGRTSLQRTLAYTVGKAKSLHMHAEG